MNLDRVKGEEPLILFRCLDTEMWRRKFERESGRMRVDHIVIRPIRGGGGRCTPPIQH